MKLLTTKDVEKMFGVGSVLAEVAHDLLDTIEIVIPGPPVPSARKQARAVRTKSGRSFVQMYSPKKSRSAIYFEKVAEAARRAVRARGWHIEPRATYYVRFIVYRDALRGDFDNFQKAFTDPMNKVVWKDDRQITEWSGVLLLDRKNPRAIVRVERRMG